MSNNTIIFYTKKIFFIHPRLRPFYLLLFINLCGSIKKLYLKVYSIFSNFRSQRIINLVTRTTLVMAGEQNVPPKSSKLFLENQLHWQTGKAAIAKRSMIYIAPKMTTTTTTTTTTKKRRKTLKNEFAKAELLIVWNRLKATKSRQQRKTIATRQRKRIKRKQWLRGKRTRELRSRMRRLIWLVPSRRIVSLR